jgi:ubiquinone/menaquinone biosynthesis C-methylase UbiE
MLHGLPIPDRAFDLAYKAQHAALRAPMTGLQRFRSWRRGATGSIGSRARQTEVEALQSRYAELLDRDLENVRAGLYPRELLFSLPLRRYARSLPQLVREVRAVQRRARQGNYEDLPDGVGLEQYPEYFRRNFHWQTDGYLSRDSAEIYELSVEFLFMGAADVMRRQVLPPLVRHLRAQPQGRRRILDVACGAGSMLRQIATALPGERYFGLDLSPFYVEVARERLRDVPDVSLVAENAESLPYRDGYFDAVTSVYLFHELPRDARRRVLGEMFRVLRPGGVLVIEDSAQLSESGEIASYLEGFVRAMHEPYYRGYIADDLALALTQCGFEVRCVESCFVAKVVHAQKPG